MFFQAISLSCVVLLSSAVSYASSRTKSKRVVELSVEDDDILSPRKYADADLSSGNPGNSLSERFRRFSLSSLKKLSSGRKWSQHHADSDLVKLLGEECYFVRSDTLNPAQARAVAMSVSLSHLVLKNIKVSKETASLLSSSFLETLEFHDCEFEENALENLTKSVWLSKLKFVRSPVTCENLCYLAEFSDSLYSVVIAGVEIKKDPSEFMRKFDVVLVESF